MFPQTKHPIPCPCCKQAVSAPTLEIIIDHYGIPPLQARILHAVWRGTGQPVQTARIYKSMYAEVSEHRPDPERLYSAFNVALCHLRKKLAGSGITIENAGYAQGYRVAMDRPASD